jgi:hypothetical protein
MFLAEAVVFLVIVALLLRRDLNAIGRCSFRGGWKLAAIVAGLFLVQAVVILYVPGQTTLQMTVLMLSQVALIFLVILNHHLPGAKLLALGIVLNTTVMVANGGWMPVTPETCHFIHPDRVVEELGRAPNSKGITLPRSETRLWILSDIVRVKVPWRRTAVSIGDLVVLAGIAQFIFQATSRKQTPSPASVMAGDGMKPAGAE